MNICVFYTYITNDILHIHVLLQLLRLVFKFYKEDLQKLTFMEFNTYCTCSLTTTTIDTKL